ncbi:MAG: hypothetical protein OCD02_07885 [Spirochaetaceae bacterium]
MKIKVLSILLLPLLMFGCSNFIDNETNIGVNAILHSDESRSLADVGNVTNLKLWIADEDVDYQEVNPTSYDSTVYFDSLDPTTLADLGVRLIESSTSEIEFDIITNVVMTFSLRVECDSGRVFTGEVERSIVPNISTIQIDIYETSVSSTGEDITNVFEG